MDIDIFDVLLAILIVAIILHVYFYKKSEEFTNTEVKRSCNKCEGIPDQMCYDPQNTTICESPMFFDKTGNRCDKFCNMNITKATGCDNDDERRQFVNRELNRQRANKVDRLVRFEQPAQPTQPAAQPAENFANLEHFDGAQGAEDTQNAEYLDKQLEFRDKLWGLSGSSADLVDKVYRVRENCDCVEGQRISDIYDDLVQTNYNGNKCDGFIAGTSIPHSRCALRSGVDETNSSPELYYTTGSNGKTYKPDTWSYDNEHGTSGGYVDDELLASDPMWSENSAIAE